ncbi:hypothetical protein BBO99_00009342 [Phytophthora kernoviae]|uniref:Transmembrane protein n=2 Tax=Phytophthora kernoviae TaxID=325452 RepID=A0A3F2RCC0_9STRA|nr:hypothetical protein G195_010920 [Phytophthora kernoviae 00238/432]KAG2508056.1 hypothetical protein JM18_009188 [Phytophthora kernoviae]KAG2515846.1 hypothetical protein JM16_007703 [Phytophthora kernoviae]RLN26579.1 hypothetical protein BBI17_009365 [Phytophthora kernoviae]RLN52721.1 hypothetical protein BBP00_00009566 [Phytophthora kernoviae]
MAPTPAAEGVDHNGLVVGKWKSPIFACYSSCIPNAFMSFACPGVSVAQICARLGLANFYAVLFGYLSVYGLVLIAAVTHIAVVTTLAVITSVLALLFSIRIRFRMRYLFSISGSLMEDLASSICCSCCAVAQMADHAESFESGSCAIAPRATLQGYTFG